MLELEEALRRILAAIPQPVSESVALTEAHGRVLAEQVRSPLDLPVFDNSAMDGYAVRAGDVAAAKPDSPVRLRLVGKVAAGETSWAEVKAGTCVRLFTGSPLPPGADAVVIQEDTRVESSDAGAVLFLDSVKPSENVRHRGEDVKQGELLAQAGEVLTTGRIGLLAAAGSTHVGVGRRPIAGLLATGAELQEPGQPLGPGRIYDSNRIGLGVLLGCAGGVAKLFPLLPDKLDVTRQGLEQALAQCDVVVTSGGVSVGEMDFVRSALERAGGELQFWKVAIKPGRPFVFGRYQTKLLFGLPGNPVSALVTFLLLVRPALLRWQGAMDVALPRHPGVLADPLSNPGPRRHFMRVKVDAAGNIRSAGRQASHVLSSLAAANGLVDVPPGTNLPPGTAVQVIRWE